MYVQDHALDIMCFTEIWLKNTDENSVIYITNYTLVRKDRIYAKHVGVCLYMKDSTECPKKSYTLFDFM